MYNPVATYRIQFNKDFNLTDFEKAHSYLQKLGVGAIYASPVFTSVPGSTHGYDGIDPNNINPEIGSLQQFTASAKKLKAGGIGWLQDIVPNHMGVHPYNIWLTDVLEKGKKSKYSGFFDTGLAGDFFSDKLIMMPFLGASLSEVIESGELTVAYQDNKLVLKYFDKYWPLNQQSYSKISLGSNDLKEIQNAELDTLLSGINADKELVKDIAGLQYYRLCSYKETDSKINYRRFFTINSLMCINIRHPGVFAAYHQLIKKLINEAIISGLRIDHIDGLYDPEKYLQDLRELTGDETYIVAEKILEAGETLPAKWPIEGTTGYDFLAQVNNLLTDGSSVKKFTLFYQEMVEDNTAVEDQIKAKKTAFLNDQMRGELDNLFNYFCRLNLANEIELQMAGAENVKNAIGRVLINCPVYRFYGHHMPLKAAELDSLRILLNVIAKDKMLQPAAALLTQVLIVRPLEHKTAFNEQVLKFYQRLMQFSGPLMAKGVEDTLMYTYNRFIGHNEVGDAPAAFGIDVKEFHKLMMQRQNHWPMALNATSTHDTKRGEDVRARLNVLTAIPDDWFSIVRQWQDLENNLPMPDANDKYFIYQTITGSYPMPGQRDETFGERLNEYLIKVLREGKQNSGWAKPGEEYEKATLNFAAALLNKQGTFWPLFDSFRRQIADHGIINSLLQVALKFTCPGVPDVYQGCELWDLSFVDPDNRRPVDYSLREKFLDKPMPINSSACLSQLWDDRCDGHIKLWLTQQLFTLRRSDPDLFSKGEYLPLKVKGIYKENIIAFARRYQNKWLIVAAPLYTASICKKQGVEPICINWKDTRIAIPAEAPSVWSALLSGANLTVKADILISDIFKELPIAILSSEHQNNDRGAGILMHISSLPSNFGIGDMGPGAKTFANFLSRCGQKYWQLLPINPISASQNYSPYSALCSMAGNTLLISPVLLLKEGLLSDADLKESYLTQTAAVNFARVQDVKQPLFDVAYNNFRLNNFSQLKKDFSLFCLEEAAWLNDFALYLAVKDNHDGQPWYHWNEDLKSRNTVAVNLFKNAHGNAIDKIKWLQFIFYRQWHQLREHCKTLGIKIFGDLPFYVSYDSADVWANQNLFALDTDGAMAGIAGVPPDYFNADGQLWGMPVYNWAVMKKDGYRWWITRLKKNIELFDLVRLDHFRAFASYWQVPAGQLTAKNGRWLPGPGADFFDAVEIALGRLPFVAEDLGDIDEKVFALRDKFKLPGMKILQFAFGNDMPRSPYIPHNYNKNAVVYTGTHDNNTVLGWYDHDAGKEVQQRLTEYSGISVKRKNVNEILMRLAYASTANIAIVPMQDILNLGTGSRMNNPSSPDNNWLWRMLPKLMSTDIEENLLKLVKLCNRL